MQNNAQLYKNCQTGFDFPSSVMLHESSSYSHLFIDYHEVKSRFKLFALQSNLSGMLSYMYLIDYSSALLGENGLHCSKS